MNTIFGVRKQRSVFLAGNRKLIYILYFKRYTLLLCLRSVKQSVLKRPCSRPKELLNIFKDAAISFHTHTMLKMPDRTLGHRRLQSLHLSCNCDLERVNATYVAGDVSFLFGDFFFSFFFPSLSYWFSFLRFLFSFLLGVFYLSH
jgi:hypothetical protein